MHLHEQSLEVFHFGASLWRLIGLVRFVRLVGLVWFVGLLPGLCLVLAGHADIECGDHLSPDVCAGGAEEGHVAGLEVEAGEVSELLQHLTWLRLAAAWRLIGLAWLVSTITTTARLIRLVRLLTQKDGEFKWMVVISCHLFSGDHRQACNKQEFVHFRVDFYSKELKHKVERSNHFKRVFKCDLAID